MVSVLWWVTGFSLCFWCLFLCAYTLPLSNFIRFFLFSFYVLLLHIYLFWFWIFIFVLKKLLVPGIWKCCLSPGTGAPTKPAISLFTDNVRCIYNNSLDKESPKNYFPCWLVLIQYCTTSLPLITRLLLLAEFSRWRVCTMIPRNLDFSTLKMYFLFINILISWCKSQIIKQGFHLDISITWFCKS